MGRLRLTEDGKILINKLRNFFKKHNWELYSDGIKNPDWGYIWHKYLDEPHLFNEKEWEEIGFNRRRQLEEKMKVKGFKEYNDAVSDELLRDKNQIEKEIKEAEKIVKGVNPEIMFRSGVSSSGVYYFRPISSVLIVGYD